MRRTTICRSDRAALLALVAGLLAGVVAPSLEAQDTTQARADSARAAQDTSQAPPPAGAVSGGQLPATHTVVAGETLWSIAQLYFSDPLLWPEVYRLNTSLIDDPHWIYPGEVLNIGSVVAVAQAPAETTAVVPPPPAPTETYLTIFERRRTPGEAVKDVLRAYANPAYRPLRRGEFYAAGFLTENERLPWGRVLGNTSPPAIPRLTERSTASQFDQIAIDPPRNASYHVGDSLLIARVDRDIEGWGGVVVPLGVVRVTEVQRRQVLADVIMQFGRIHDGHLVMPLEPFRDPGVTRPTPVEQGLEGHVVAARDLHGLADLQQILFINRGRAEGVTPGDVFEVFRPASGVPGTASEEVRMVLEIVHTREHSASGLVLTINHPDVRPGMPVRLVRKMPS